MAVKLNWKPAYSVGVKDFDEDHREMIAQADALIACFRQKDPDAAARNCLDNLIEYTIFHFEREEQALRDADFPGYEAHLLEHNLLLRSLLKFKADARYHRLTPDEIADFITEWVLAHIRDEDMKYKEHLAAHGVTHIPPARALSD